MVDILDKLKLRILAVHGGPKDIRSGWNLTEGDSIMHLEAALEIERLRAALIEAEAGLIFAGADVEPAGDFVPSPTAALRIVRAALLRPNAVAQREP